MFGGIVVFSIIEVTFIPILSLNLSYVYFADVYSSLDNRKIQCPSQFPKFRSSSSCPLHLVCLYLDGPARFCVSGYLPHNGWKHDHQRFFSLYIVCPLFSLILSITGSCHSFLNLLLSDISLSVTWIFWLAAAAALTQSVGGSLDCSIQTKFVYCGHLNALEGFAWLIWYVSCF